MKDALLATLGHFIWLGLAVGLAVAILSRGQRSPEGRYTLAAGGMLALAGLAILTFSVSLADPRWVDLGSVSSLLSDSWKSSIMLAWGLGASLGGVRLAWQAFAAYRMTRLPSLALTDPIRATVDRLAERLGIKQAPRVILNEEITMPSVFGLVRHVLLLPASYATTLHTDELEGIIAHELAHIRRADVLVNILQSILEAVFFFHPAVWWLGSEMRTQRELCCDRLAAQATGNPAALARALGRLALDRQPALAAAAGGGRVVDRIRLLAAAPALPTIPWGRLLGLVSFVIALASWVPSPTAEAPARVMPGNVLQVVGLPMSSTEGEPDTLMISVERMQSADGMEIEYQVIWTPDSSEESNRIILRQADEPTGEQSERFIFLGEPSIP